MMNIIHKLFVIGVFGLAAYSISYALKGSSVFSNQEGAKQDAQQNKDKYDNLATEKTNKIQKDVEQKMSDSLGELTEAAKNNSELRQKLQEAQDYINKERDKALQEAQQQAQEIQNEVNKGIAEARTKLEKKFAHEQQQ